MKNHAKRKRRFINQMKRYGFLTYVFFEKSIKNNKMKQINFFPGFNKIYDTQIVFDLVSCSSCIKFCCIILYLFPKNFRR